MDMIDINYDRAKVFLEKQLKVHVSKRNGSFYNGLITEVSSDFFFIEDQKDGKQLVFFKELNKPIETFMEAER
jgi:hypothetical protein